MKVFLKSELKSFSFFKKTFIEKIKPVPLPAKKPSQHYYMKKFLFYAVSKQVSLYSTEFSRCLIMTVKGHILTK